MMLEYILCLGIYFWLIVVEYCIVREDAETLSIGITTMLEYILCLGIYFWLIVVEYCIVRKDAETLSILIATMPVIQTRLHVAGLQLLKTLSPTQETLPPKQKTLSPIQKTLPPIQETLPPIQETLSPKQESLSPKQKTFPPKRKLPFTIFSTARQDMKPLTGYAVFLQPCQRLKIPDSGYIVFISGSASSTAVSPPRRSLQGLKVCYSSFCSKLP